MSHFVHCRGIKWCTMCWWHTKGKNGKRVENHHGNHYRPNYTVVIFNCYLGISFTAKGLYGLWLSTLGLWTLAAVVWGSQLYLFQIWIVFVLYLNCICVHLLCLLAIVVWSLQLKLRPFTTIHIYFHRPHLSSLFSPGVDCIYCPAPRACLCMEGGFQGSKTAQEPFKLVPLHWARHKKSNSAFYNLCIFFINFRYTLHWR